MKALPVPAPDLTRPMPVETAIRLVEEDPPDWPFEGPPEWPEEEAEAPLRPALGPALVTAAALTAVLGSLGTVVVLGSLLLR